MTTIHLVRHGVPAVDPATHPASWRLEPVGNSDVERLAASGFLPAEAAWFTSPAPKCVETAEILRRSLGVEAVGEVEDLRELERPEGWVDNFAMTMHRSFLAEDSPAAHLWETGTQVRTRVALAVRRLMEENPDRDLVLVGHAAAWTYLVSELTASPPDVAGWEGMGMPDHCALEVERTSRHAASPAQAGAVKVRMEQMWGAWMRSGN